MRGGEEEREGMEGCEAGGGEERRGEERQQLTFQSVSVAPS